MRNLLRRFVRRLLHGTSVRYNRQLVTMLVVCFAPMAVRAQPRDSMTRVVPDSQTISAGKRYQANALHRWFIGNTYRDLWVAPIRVPMLDLATFAGGLHATKAGGGMQTKSLRFETANGTGYVFRLVDKIVTSGPAALQDTPIDRIFQDQVSALHPAAAQLAEAVSEASGVMHPTAMFVVMPNDSALGKFRQEFAGHLGIIEAYPNIPEHGTGFEGAVKIIDSIELLKLLNSDWREHIDARAFLTARLADYLINDTDRHQGNWKWARLEAGAASPWHPIARDRDHAFVAYDGWFMHLVRSQAPVLVSLNDAPTSAGLTQSRTFDARMLEGVERSVWDSIALSLQARVTDSVITATTHAMPQEYMASAHVLELAMRKRRAALPTVAAQFYHLLSNRVEVHGTDSSDRAVITRSGDGIVDVRIESDGHPFFTRRFDAKETSEILVYLQGGDDSAVVTGHVERSIPIRLVGGNGHNSFVDSSTVDGKGHLARLYDAGSGADVHFGADTLFDRRPWEKENDSLVPPHADFGSKLQPIVGMSFHRRIGFTPRLGVARYGYGYATRPYSYMMKAEGEYANSFGGARVVLTADKRFEASPLHVTAVARMSDFEVVNFNGLGNATIDSGAVSDYFEVRQRQWMVHPALALAVGPNIDLSLGPVLQHSVTDSTPGRYLSRTMPYGVGTFNQAALQLSAQYEWRGTRNDPEHTHHRVHVQANALYFPAVMDVRSAFSKINIAGGTSITLPVPLHPFLVFRAGAEKIFGTFPFYEASTIGGRGTTRYMDTQRYAGDASVFATTELRVPLVHFRLLLPLRAGILGLAETGRVSVRGDSPGGWYARTGEGVWIGRGTASPVVTFSWTTEPGHPGVHVRLGLNF